MGKYVVHPDEPRSSTWVVCHRNTLLDWGGRLFFVGAIGASAAFISQAWGWKAPTRYEPIILFCIVAGLGAIPWLWLQVWLLRMQRKRRLVWLDNDHLRIAAAAANNRIAANLSLEQWTAARVRLFKLMVDGQKYAAETRQALALADDAAARGCRDLVAEHEQIASNHALDFNRVLAEIKALF